MFQEGAQLLVRPRQRMKGEEKNETQHQKMFFQSKLKNSGFGSAILCVDNVDTKSMLER
jgi:hypothetical protein